MDPKNKVPCGLNLSELTDLSRLGEMVAISAAINATESRSTQDEQGGAKISPVSLTLTLSGKNLSHH